MQTELRQWQAFAATARLAGFTAAARELGVGQPAVSQLVRRLETRLGLVLFDRDGRSVTPTAAARALLPHATAMLHAVTGLERAVADVADGSAGHLRLVSTPGSTEVVRHLLDTLSVRRPDITVELVPRPRGGRREGLRGKEIDFALARSTPTARGVAYTPVHAEPWVVMLAASHPLVNTDVPDLAALARFPFASLGPASPALAAHRDAAAQAGVEARPGPALTSVDDLQVYVGATEAWSLITESGATRLPAGLVALPAPAPLGPARLWLAHRTSTPATERAVLDLVRESNG